MDIKNTVRNTRLSKLYVPFKHIVLYNFTHDATEQSFKTLSEHLFDESPSTYIPAASMKYRHLAECLFTWSPVGALDAANHVKLLRQRPISELAFPSITACRQKTPASSRVYMMYCCCCSDCRINAEIVTPSTVVAIALLEPSPTKINLW